MRILKVSLILGLLSGCSSVEMHVESSPSAADIFLVTESSRKKIASTPADISREELGANKNFHLVISKEGFAPHSLLFESRKVPSRGKIFVELSEASKAVAQESTVRLQSEVDIVTRKVALIQNELLKRNFDRAEVFAKELLAERPKLSVGWSLLANTYFLQRRKGEALSAYEKALQSDPKNQETLRMIERLGGRGVANE